MMSGLAMQIQVIHALILREMKSRFGEHKLGYLWALFEPVMFIGMFAGMGYMGARTSPGHMPLLAFMTSGFLPFLFFRATTSSVQAAIDANRGLLYYPRVRPLDLVIARIILEFSTYVCIVAILLTTAATLENVPTPDFGQLALGLFLAGAFGSGMGLIVCGLSVFSQAIPRLYGAASRPLMWISGCFFSINSIPSAPRHLLLHNPLIHVVETFRIGVFPSYRPYGIDPWFPAIVSLAAWFFGLTLERIARRHVHAT